MRQGDTVAIVSPSGPPDAVLLRRGIARLEEFGLKVVTGEHVLDRQELDFLAGPDAGRAADLQAAWCDPAVSAVFCSRGGYGAAKLLDLLDWDAMRAAGPKVLLGSSDITALHHAFAAELGVPTLHGPMPACSTIAGEQGPEPESWEHLRAALFGTAPPVRAAAVLAPGRAEGVLTGGNLSLLASLCGTRYQPSFAGRIVLLEDIGEEPYRIDRMLTQLLQAGAFAGVRGVVLGSWVECRDPFPVLRERLLPLGVPILAGLPVGHGSPQLSVWLGALGVIDTESCSLTGMFRDGEQAR
ncbi:S66 peptidase family protein [Nonomuraea cavernae]|uniref:Carboxypeptidase n=1 Tax=Nonomuraea cavernae TaxID=2045107 RepID=A0A917Z912_9ACTN|nr:LD-carboxypeptidase [Nonomuraea cavernae]MCA2189131.1 LD-carboxypeptidase [Nonomuraea cavernae]GGO76259.1 putative carboxypeptidase [Nonomuraea cavernae]